MVSYEFYINEYHGASLTEAEWPVMEARAQLQMEKWQRSIRFEGDERAFAMAICATAESMGEMDAGGCLRSASIGSVSVEYRVYGREKAMLNRVGTYLDVYRGVG